MKTSGDVSGTFASIAVEMEKIGHDDEGTYTYSFGKKWRDPIAGLKWRMPAHVRRIHKNRTGLPLKVITDEPMFWTQAQRKTFGELATRPLVGLYELEATLTMGGQPDLELSHWHRDADDADILPDEYNIEDYGFADPVRETYRNVQFSDPSPVDATHDAVTMKGRLYGDNVMHWRIGHTYCILAWLGQLEEEGSDTAQAFCFWVLGIKPLHKTPKLPKKVSEHDPEHKAEKARNAIDGLEPHVDAALRAIESYVASGDYTPDRALERVRLLRSFLSYITRESLEGIATELTNIDPGHQHNIVPPSDGDKRCPEGLAEDDYIAYVEGDKDAPIEVYRVMGNLQILISAAVMAVGISLETRKDYTKENALETLGSLGERLFKVRERCLERADNALATGGATMTADNEAMPAENELVPESPRMIKIHIPAGAADKAHKKGLDASLNNANDAINNLSPIVATVISDMGSSLASKDHSPEDARKTRQSLKDLLIRARHECAAVIEYSMDELGSQREDYPDPPSTAVEDPFTSPHEQVRRASLARTGDAGARIPETLAFLSFHVAVASMAITESTHAGGGSATEASRVKVRSLWEHVDGELRKCIAAIDGAPTSA